MTFDEYGLTVLRTNQNELATRKVSMKYSKTNIFGWTLSILLTAFLCLASASGKFMDFPDKEEMFAKMGWTTETMFVIGVVEVAIALLFLVPRSAFIAAILLTAYFGGAIATHVRVSEPFIFPIAFGVITWIALGLRDKRIFQLAFGSQRAIPQDHNSNLAQH